MTTTSEAMLPMIRRGVRSFRALIARNFAAFGLIALGFALHDATWSRIVAAVILLAFSVFYLLVPWVRGGFVGASTLFELVENAPQRTVWLAVHQVPNRLTHLQVHDEDRHSWRLRLPPGDVAALIASWRTLAPDAHVSMANTQREVEWFHDPTAPRRWPPSPPLELTSGGFKPPEAQPR